MKKSSLRILAGLLASVFIFGACSNNNDNANQQPDTNTDTGIEATEDETEDEQETEAPAPDGYSGKTDLVLVTAAMPPNLDPTLTNDNASSRVMKQIYGTLLNQDADLNIIPGLAESWEFEDETTLNMKLKEGVKFHNGEDFTGDDVKFSIERALESPFSSHIVETISEVIVNDDHNITIKLETPFSPILAHLAHTTTSIVNRKAVEDVGDEEHGQNPIGTGPFMFDTLVAGDRVELVRFDDYYEDLPKIERIIIRSMPEAANRAIEIETGAADLAYDILPEDVDRIEENPNTRIIRDMNLSSTYVGFNCQKEPFNDARVRQAINYVLDKDAIVRNVYKGSGAPSYGPLASMVWASAQDELEPYEYNVDKAKELMIEAGYEDGFETTIWTNENTQRVDIAQIIQSQLKLINIDCEVEIVEWATYLDSTAAGEHNMFILGWVTVTGDPDYGLYAPFHSSQFGSAGNRTFFDNAEADALLDEARRETDQDKRKELYYEVQKIIRDEAPWIFTWQGEEISGASANLRGFENSPAGHHPLWNIYFE